MSTVAEISEAIEKLDVKDQVELLRILPQYLKVSPEELAQLAEPAFEFWTILRMPSTIKCKQGDVVLVPFPFTDFTSKKQRPALVVSPDALNAARDDVLVAAITSQVPAQLAVDEFLIPAK